MQYMGVVQCQGNTDKNGCLGNYINQIKDSYSSQMREHDKTIQHGLIISFQK